jgi:group I intron endonuclease
MQLKINQYDTVEEKEKGQACHVYMAKNTINNKIYIGKTVVGLKKRISRHFYDASKGSNHIFHRAIIKYGRESFVFNVISLCRDDKEALEKEKELIVFYNSKIPVGYNMTDGGEGFSGLGRTKEHRRKISEALTGRVMAEETKKKLSNALTGRTLSTEHLQNIKQSHSTVTFKEKIRNANLGRKLSPEQIEKIRLKNIGRPYCGKPHSEETRKKIGDSSRARKRTEEWKKRISNSNKGKKMSEDAKQKMRLAKLGKPSLKKGKTYTNQNQLGGVN